jgi:hypothetical protein
MASSKFTSRKPCNGVIEVIVIAYLRLYKAQQITVSKVEGKVDGEMI